MSRRRDVGDPGRVVDAGTAVRPADIDTDAGGRPRRWPSLILVVAFVVGFALVSSVVLVRGRLLDDDLYAAALVQSDAYERVYTEVLADPELADLKEDLLGGVEAAGPEPAQVRTVATSSLRLVAPPSTLQRGTETFIGATLAYLRGDTARLDGDVDVSGVPGRIRESAVAWVHGELAAAETRLVSPEDYEEAVDAVADVLESGRLPDTIPVIGGTTVDPQQVVEVITDRLGSDVDPRLLEQIRAAVLSGNERDGLIDATTHLIAGRADAATADLRASLEDRRELDVVTELADRAGRSRNEIVGQLNTVRTAASWFGPWTAAVGGALMAGSAAGIVWLDRRCLRRAGFLLATAAIASGILIVAAWAAVAWLIDAPLAPATETGPGTWNLPAGLRLLLADLESALADQLVVTVRRLAVVPLAAGGALAAGIALAPRFRLPSPRAGVAVGATAAVAVGLAVWVVPVRWAGAETRACNGHAELCDRRYDEVVYAATHNSMSSPDVVLVWPEHDGDIRAQLDAGVRALLIDTHHWTPLVSDEQLAAAEPFLPASVAEPLFDALGPLREGRYGTYLCHNQCALGAVPLVDALVSIREFLDENHDEVVTLVVQDAISPAETVDAFTEAGLDPYRHEHDEGSPWATLGELIEADERLVVFAENEGPPPGWYHQAFEHMQDTPYRFSSVEEFNCDANRGDRDATLYLINHWVTRPNHAPDRATATEVNRHDVIVDRARACERERGQMPNYIAVDFYGIGDLTEAVDTLNGVD